VPYSAVEVIGARPTIAVLQACGELELTAITPHENGFTASRVGPQPK
jgi:hypothetical protein